MLRKIKQKATKWTTIPRKTTDVRLKRLFLHSNPNNPPPDGKENPLHEPNDMNQLNKLRGRNKILPTISPIPTMIPEIPIKPKAPSPNCVVAPIHVPYTPLQKDNSRPGEQAAHLQLQAFTGSLSIYYTNAFSLSLTAVCHARTQKQYSFSLHKLQDGF